MKSIGFAVALFLLFLGCSSDKKVTTASPLQFNWPLPQSFQVEELIGKKGARLQILFTCELIETNQELILRWLDTQFLSFNGEKVSESEALKKELAPVEAMFRYPPFRITSQGEFLETLNAEESTKEVNRLLDKVAPERPEDARKFYDKLAESQTGKQMIDRIYGQIWGTWVQMWVDVNLADGQTVSEDGNIPFGEGHNLPAKMTLSNLGPVASDTNLLSLKYEEKITANDLGGTMEDFLGKLAKETELKEAEPLPSNVSFERATIMEVYTERKTLKPHWAKRTMVTTTSAPGEKKEIALEVHEYLFHWSDERASKSNK